MALSNDKRHLHPKDALLLAAPHTWAASIMPALLSIAFAYSMQGFLSVSLTIALLIAVVLMQSSVNTFNDYFDFVKGADSKNDNVEESDAVLVYNNINPKSALALAIAFLIVAFLLGIYCIVSSGWIPLVIAIVGAFIVVVYSGGKTPISYLPIGEAISGITMGGLIPLASFYVLTDSLNWMILVWSIPLIINIGLIMMTNNTCDIEKDISAGRKTLPVILGRLRARTLYKTLIAISVISTVLIVGIWFPSGIIVLPFMLLALYPIISKMFISPLEPKVRVGAMAAVCNMNIVLGTFYAVAVFASNVQLIL
ncbi:prenyltransferase [Adlercreutzia sp. ZJ154]|uniref:prenyltransferase n=1 Tax=Adlercreutzia sp. ZJ154 TaxID=2709790 RepID=UPI0013EDCDD9|nr:prenyltransferase [Adlercreutzia sp. ZJ154]